MTTNERRAHDEALDNQMSSLVRRSYRTIWTIMAVLGLLILGLVAVVVILLSIVLGNQTQLHNQQKQLTAQNKVLRHETQHVINVESRNQNSKCEFYNVIGTVPVPLEPFPTKRTVKVVLAARGAYVEAHCANKLTPPGKVLRKAAARYHLSLHPK